MFDVSLLDPAELRALDDSALIGAIGEGARVSAAADARRLAGIAELVRRRCTDEHPDWACDDWDAAAAEVAAALTLGHGRACAQMDLAVALRDRLPRIAALFLTGHLGLRTVTTIAARTALVTDPDAIATLDSRIADSARALGPLSQYKLEQALDGWVDQIDPGAVRRTRNNVRGRDFTIGDPHDTAGTTSVWGRLTTPDAALLGQRLAIMIRQVCHDDPRTMAQRRADAIGALAAGSTHLTCRCADPNCSAAADDGRATSITVHVVAEQSAAQDAPDPHLDGAGMAPDTRPDTSTTPPGGRPALIPGVHGGIIPTPLLAQLIAHGARIRTVKNPGEAAEPGYRPSTALDEFIRIRDLTCRFPGCDAPAVHADIDHTIPWPYGPTHASNCATYCRKHHLLKTFWPGWHDRQLPDGTLAVTTPTGHTYTTTPASRLLFPCWDTSTPTAPISRPSSTKSPARTLMMPTRKRTRARARADRIAAERDLNATRIAEHNRPPPF